MKKEAIKWILIGLFVLAAGACYVTGVFDGGGTGKTVITADGGSRMAINADGKSSADSSETGDGSKALEDDQTAEKTGVSDNQETLQGHEVTDKPEASEGMTENAVSDAKIFVHVCGEVISPGVYEMEQGSRIFEAVSQAGGYTEQAASDFLNMAQQLEDGMKLTVPDKETARALSAQMDQAGVSQNAAGVTGGGVSGGGVTGGGVSGSGKAGGGSSGTVPGKEGTSAKVNINTAAKEQLMTLTGVGEAKAADIIAYREQNGPFKKIEDIMKVSGIKEAGFQKIRENITV